MSNYPAHEGQVSRVSEESITHNPMPKTSAIDEVSLATAISPTDSTSSSPILLTPIDAEASRSSVTGTSPPEALEPYSIFTPKQKWAIVILAACAGVLTPLAGNIYFPAIPTLAHAFNKTTQDINLTVTIYMVFQAVTPSLWGSCADSYGRRPVYLCCMTLFAASQIGLAVIPTSSYAALMVLRCVSAAGSASILALNAGTVGDVATPGERGRYMGFVQMGPMLGPCIGPVFGGFLNQELGWRAIFWFLAILAFSIFIPFILFFPETLHSIVGNGSIPATGLNQTVWSILSHHWKEHSVDTDKRIIEATKQPKKEFNPLAGLRYFLEKDVAIILFFNAFNYTSFYAVTTTLATVFEDTYGLSTSASGACYLAVGGGSFVATFTSGRILDREFRKARVRLERQRLLGTDVESAEGDEKHGTELLDEARIEAIVAEKMKTPLDPYRLLDFPLERTRLKHQPFYSLMFWGSTIANGWVVQAHAPLAVALVLQFIIGWSIVSVMQISQVMLIDFYPGKGASVTANNNLCRCLIGAVGTAVVDPMKRSMGSGWTMMIFIAVPIAFSPLVALERSRGVTWRNERAERARVQVADEQATSKDTATGA